MPFTYQSVVDLARIPLNDADQARYPDSTLLLFLNHGLLQILKRRPDLFIGQFASPLDGQNELVDTFPLPPEYAQTVADYVTARAEMTDDEHVNSGRAAIFMQIFGGEAQP
ncbi:MAG TPA: DUF6682 family protein [Nitrosospira sp.]|jgi:hypothetical protein|nr:DUF6682 family protein [Nitrosospira sp.]